MLFGFIYYSAPRPPNCVAVERSRVMATDHQVALSRTHHRLPSTPSQHAAQQPRPVPAFLKKLYEMVNDPQNVALIRWSDSGDSFFGQYTPVIFSHSSFSFSLRLFSPFYLLPLSLPTSPRPRTICKRSPRQMVQAPELFFLCSPAQHVRFS